ncbi:hypothetical protein WMO79_01355 [Micrococcaceae bacterium Sec7.4]
MNASTRLLTVTACAALLAAATGCSGVSQIGHGAAGLGNHPAPAASAPAIGAATDGQLRQVHSPGTVAVDEQLSAGECHVVVLNAAEGRYLPDPHCTPGAIDPAVTQANIGTTICSRGYTDTVRPPQEATAPLKRQSLAQYGQSGSPTTEYDHLVSLELGGTNAVSNLYPEPNRAGATDFLNPKDAVERDLNKAVCSHRIPLAAAQQAIATNWTTALTALGL